MDDFDSGPQWNPGADTPTYGNPATPDQAPIMKAGAIQGDTPPPNPNATNDPAKTEAKPDDPNKSFLTTAREKLQDLATNIRSGLGAKDPSKPNEPLATGLGNMIKAAGGAPMGGGSPGQQQPPPPHAPFASASNNAALRSQALGLMAKAGGADRGGASHKAVADLTKIYNTQSPFASA